LGHPSHFPEPILPYTSSSIKGKVFDNLAHYYYFPHQRILPYTSGSNASDNKLGSTSYFRQLILPYASSAFKYKTSGKLNYPSYFSTSRQLIYASSAIKSKVSDKLGYSYYFPVSRQLIHTSSTKSEVPDNLDSSHVAKDEAYSKLVSLLETCVYKDKRSIFRALLESEKENFNLKIAKKDHELAIAAIKTVSYA
jgi:hypothetical protein